MLYNVAPQWGGTDNGILRGAFLIVYPITLCHLESLRTTGKMLYFEGFFDQFSEPQKFYILIIGLISMIEFWLLTFTGVFVIFVSIFS